MATPEKTAAAPAKDPLGILVVEDERDIREMVALMVKGMGHTVYTANNGREALEQVHQAPVDIVLLDLMMPEMDGFEFCQAVKADGSLPDLHIIITSAKEALEDKVKGLELGAADYLTKPFSLTELRARIRVGERITRSQKELKEQKVLLERLAREDKLTGLYNRRHFEERAVEECNRAQRYDRPLSLLLCDLDHFKQVNDQYGHSAGDTVLQQVGQTIQDCCRTSDLSARLGGEEFTVMLTETNLEEAQLVAERLCTAIRVLTFAHPSGQFHVTMSIGVAEVAPTQTLEELLKEADEALYAAKRTGRNRVVLAPDLASLTASEQADHAA
jgi:diguanylate cyclase (GGDEF)-like protein